MRRKIVALCLVLLLGACAQQIPPMNFSVPNVGPVGKKIDAEVKAITVTVARPDEKTGNINPGVDAVLPLWKEALQDAFDHMAIFRDDSSRKISIAVKVLKLDTPTFGIAMTTSTSARYEMIDRATGGLIYTQDFNSEATVPGDYAFLGIARARESINRAVQNNISQFLQALEAVDVTKPMFPAK